MRADPIENSNNIEHPDICGHCKFFTPQCAEIEIAENVESMIGIQLQPHRDFARDFHHHRKEGHARSLRRNLLPCMKTMTGRLCKPLISGVQRFTRRQSSPGTLVADPRWSRNASSSEFARFFP